jgi:hypothetical protein
MPDDLPTKAPEDVSALQVGRISNPSHQAGVRRSIEVLVGGAMAVWLLLLYPARELGGEHAVLFATVALLLCLVPTVATLVWTRWATQQSAEQQMVAVLGGTGVRMGVVLVSGLILYRWVPSFAHMGFLFWLLVFYLVTLALEVTLLITGHR